MKEVYIIISPDGDFGTNMCTGKGTVYSDIKKAQEALNSTNRWSESKGYGIHELVTLEVK